MKKKGNTFPYDAVTKVLLVFFLGMLSFSIGTFVGKQFSESQDRVHKLEQQRAAEQDECSCQKK